MKRVTKAAHEAAQAEPTHLITVTQADIDAGCDGTIRSVRTATWSKSCPIALAVNRELLPGMYAQVADDVCIYLKDDEDGDVELCAVPLPREAVQFVDDFDAGLSVKPFSFTLDLR